MGSTEVQTTANEFMNSIISFFPNPLDETDVQATKVATNESVDLKSEPSSFAALIFKTAADPFVGKLSYIKVYSGDLKSDSTIWNINAKESERIGQLYSMRGQTQEPVDQISIGDIGIITKMSSALTGHTLTTKDAGLELTGISFPNPVYNMSWLNQKFFFRRVETNFTCYYDLVFEHLWILSLQHMILLIAET